MAKKKGSFGTQVKVAGGVLGLMLAARAMPGHHHHGHGISVGLTSAPGHGGSPAANRRLGQAMAAQMGWTGGQWSCLDTLWQGECVPLTTKILTRRGWLTYEEVRVGDETLGFNPASGCNEWTRILRVVHYSDSEVWRVGNRRWHADVTPGHRWWNEPLTTYKSRKRFSPKPGFLRTEDLRWDSRLRLAAPALTDGIPGLSTQEAAVLAWIQGDGHVRPNPRGTWGGRIYQSKPRQLVQIRSLLATVEHTESVVRRSDTHGWLPEHVFLLPNSYVSDLMKRSRLTELEPESFVLALSPAQRVAWLAAMVGAEGHNVGRPGDRGHVVITQNDGPLQDAIKLAVYLEGFKPSSRRHCSDGHCGTIGMTVPHVQVHKFRPHQILERQPVWCVTTSNGSWTALQDGQIFLTGNSGWSQYADTRASGLDAAGASVFAYGIPQSRPAQKMPRSAQPASLGGQSNPKAQVRWGLQYVQSTYGDPCSALAFKRAHGNQGY